MKKQLPDRKPTRYKDFDYSSVGYYFVTICADGMKSYFGKIRNGEMKLNSIGKIVEKCWYQISEHFKNVELDYFQIMPNHLHGIIIINPVGDGSPVPNKLPNENETTQLEIDGSSVPRGSQTARDGKPIIENSNSRVNLGDGKPIPYKKISLSNIVGYFKYQATKEINIMNNTSGRKLFKRSFYDRIIRNEKELYNIRKYISDNPLKWEFEKNLPENLDI